MHTQDNAKVMEALEKQTMFNYIEKLISVKIKKIVLFSIFPHTAAPNLSDAHRFVLIEDLSKITQLNSGNSLN